MGRKKIQIKPITDEKTRKVTFNRRRNGILKKAYELSILCDTKVVVLMFDRKEMCHVYASEEGPNAHADLMQKYITKDFCTVDPIRNYDTSPDLQLDDPSQAVWRVSREKVAVVNTYNVTPASSSTPNLSSGHADDDDDEEADGSEQLNVKSSRTYHTKTGEAKFGMMNTPALTDKAQSPSRSVSPDVRTRKSSPQRQKQQPQYVAQPQQAIYGMQQGLGISGAGYTPVLRAGEHFTPVLYPPQPPDQAYIWPSPTITQEEMNMINSQQAAIRAQYLPGLQYAGQQLHQPSQYPAYEQPPPSKYPPTPLPPQPLLRASPRKEQAHFNHYTYPPQQNRDQFEPLRNNNSHQNAHYAHHTDNDESDAATPSDHASPQYTYQDEERYDSVQDFLPVPSPRRNSKKSSHASAPRTLPESPRRPSKASQPDESREHQPCRELAPPTAQESRRITRSQSRSPQMKARQLPAPLPITLPPVTGGMQAIHKSQIPMHLRGPSLLDEITFDPDTGVAMMESSALASWLNGAPLIQNASPGHSRETSHVRGESVSQWLNMPGIPE